MAQLTTSVYKLIKKQNILNADPAADAVDNPELSTNGLQPSAAFELLDALPRYNSHR
jgi:hypothetical protein